LCLGAEAERAGTAPLWPPFRPRPLRPLPAAGPGGRTRSPVPHPAGLPPGAFMGAKRGEKNNQKTTNKTPQNPSAQARASPVPSPRPCAGREGSAVPGFPSAAPVRARAGRNAPGPAPRPAGCGGLGFIFFSTPDGGFLPPALYLPD